MNGQHCFQPNQGWGHGHHWVDSRYQADDCNCKEDDITHLSRGQDILKALVRNDTGCTWDIVGHIVGCTWDIVGQYQQRKWNSW